MFFWILIKLRFIPILICWKKILFQLRINRPLFRWDLLPHTYITFLNNDFRCNSQATKYSIISSETCKLSYLVGSVDKNNVYFHMTCLLPKYWKLLPLSHYTFIDHAAKHIKSIINITVCLKYHKHKTKRDLHWSDRSRLAKWLKLILLKYFGIKYPVKNSFT